MAKTALQFRHNGREVAVFVDAGGNLLNALREGVGDVSVKFGCGQGGCGACTVLIDGEAHLSCLTLAETVEGRSVETADGLKTGPELHPLQKAFMDNFAAQCGYCTPGMLMAAKALIDHNPSPSRQEVVEAISGNICRCTGYEPIIISDSLRRRGQRRQARLKGPAMLELRKDIFADERDDNLKEIGKPTQRQDMLGHVTATSTYFNDHKLQGMLHLKVLRSPHSHARLRRIDVGEAERQPGVRRIISGADVPRNLNTLLSLINFGKDDEPTLAVDKVRYKGEPIVAIVADSEREAFEALAKVRVDYETLPTVFDVEEALKPGAPVVNETYPRNAFTYYDIYDHQKLRFGDVERGFAQAAHVLEQRYQMSPIEHAPTETNGSIAAPDTNGRYIVYTSTQALFFSLDTSAKILDVPSNKLHFVGGTVGGGFGGKVDTLTEPLSILGAMLTGRPVRYMFGREEEMQYGSPRGAERIYVKDGVGRDGRILARKLRVYFDSGAYTRLSSYAVVKCAAHLPGPYTIPNVHADIFCVYTNRVPATAMRGFGVTAVDFALECQMDKLAHLVGMDPMEFRILNAYRDGDMKAHRREAHNTALIECVQVAAEKAKWKLSEEVKRASSRKGGGGERAAIPPTVREASPAARPRRAAAHELRSRADARRLRQSPRARPLPPRSRARTARRGFRLCLGGGGDPDQWRQSRPTARAHPRKGAGSRAHESTEVRGSLPRKHDRRCPLSPPVLRGGDGCGEGLGRIARLFQRGP